MFVLEEFLSILFPFDVIAILRSCYYQKVHVFCADKRVRAPSRDYDLVSDTIKYKGFKLTFVKNDDAQSTPQRGRDVELLFPFVNMEGDCGISVHRKLSQGHLPWT